MLSRFKQLYPYLADMLAFGAFVIISVLLLIGLFMFVDWMFPVVDSP